MAESLASNRKMGGSVVLALWGVTFVLSYLGIGRFLAEMAEGVDRSQISKTLPLVPNIRTLKPSLLTRDSTASAIIS